MTRCLHEHDLVKLTDKSLVDIIESRLTGDVLVIAPEDNRLTELIPVSGQLTFGNNQLDLPDSADLYIDDLPVKKEEPELPFEDNSYDTVVSLFSKLGYFQRLQPFLRMTRIVREGGRILQATGLQPQSEPYHDAKYWLSNSEKVEESTIYVTRYEGFQTPELVAEYRHKGKSA